ncbi:hypothetical protein [Rhodococcus sp. SGAir0479]|uniref:hypothetical protein n=1 Tax=Rhodococcus sp. SGAir0479 TaxID=2567884 RepID=UPI0010CD678E|nr:hypothetical protein [Rhodococcus sp. SGAir0479]QCQ91194.1 hypothetical protein E7742_08045 [Rhodococcus sp. SGAir0479]
MGVSRKLAGAGVVAGLSALALVTSPALSSAQVTGSPTVTVSGSTITSTVTGLKTTLPFNYCEGYVYRGDATVFDRSTKVGEYPIAGPSLVKDQILTGASGSGTSAALPIGEYWVFTKCKEIGDTAYQVVGQPVRVAVTEEDPAAVPGLGSVEDFFRDVLNGVLSQFGS